MRHSGSDRGGRGGKGWRRRRSARGSRGLRCARTFGVRQRARRKQFSSSSVTVCISAPAPLAAHARHPPDLLCQSCSAPTYSVLTQTLYPPYARRWGVRQPTALVRRGASSSMTHARAASAPLHSKWHVLVYLCMSRSGQAHTRKAARTHTSESANVLVFNFVSFVSTMNPCHDRSATT